jgi:hypothetical protein
VTLHDLNPGFKGRVLSFGPSSEGAYAAFYHHLLRRTGSHAWWRHYVGQIDGVLWGAWNGKNTAGASFVNSHHFLSD